jgi:amidohydrolase
MPDMTPDTTRNMDGMDGMGGMGGENAPTATDQATLRAMVMADHAYLTALRRDLHRIPELGYEETLTSARVRRELDGIGVGYVAGLAGGTGILAHIPATGPATGPATTGGSGVGAVGLRADMDALPIEERTGVAHASTHEGRMHACGHDGHTAILVGVARALASLERRPNPVTLVFQPAEEGGGGGRRLCEEGALDGSKIGPPVTRIYGLHGWPELTLGRVATRPGELLAATDGFKVTIRGKQAHAAMPHLGIDPIVAAAQCVTALQTIVSRSTDPLDSMVCTVAAVHAGGTAHNVIPERAGFLGTVRTLRDGVRASARERFHEIVHHVARAHRCHAEIEYTEGYPVTRNDPALTERWFGVMRGVLGGDRVGVVERPIMGGEDFSYYGNVIPAAFFLLGLRPADRPSYPKLHAPDFDFNDDAIPIGVEAMCALALAGEVR